MVRTHYLLGLGFGHRSGLFAYFCAETFVSKAEMQWLKTENTKEVKLPFQCNKQFIKWPELLSDTPIRPNPIIQGDFYHPVFCQGWIKTEPREGISGGGSPHCCFCTSLAAVECFWYFLTLLVPLYFYYNFLLFVTRYCRFLSRLATNYCIFHALTSPGWISLWISSLLHCKALFQSLTFPSPRFPTNFLNLQVVALFIFAASFSIIKNVTPPSLK